MNIYDIAKHAGVSTATVSRILNNSGKVSDSTKEKVLKIMDELNYRPNAFARGMVTNSIMTIGVLAVDIRDIYYANVTYTIEQHLRQSGYNVILCNTGNKVENKKQYINMLVSKKIDGLILVGSVFKDDRLDSFVKSVSKNIPVVIINGYIEDSNIYCVMNNDEYGVKQAVSHLIKTGKNNIAFFQDAVSYSAQKKAAGAKGFSIYFVEKGIIGGYNGMKDIINVGFDGIICSEDDTAVGVINYLKEIGKKIPDEYGVIGFNNSILTSASLPSLTSIDANMEILGETAVKTLIKAILNEKVKNKIIINPELVIRGSTEYKGGSGE